MYDVIRNSVVLQVSVIICGVVVDENVFRGVFGGVHLLPRHDCVAEANRR